MFIEKKEYKILLFVLIILLIICAFTTNKETFSNADIERDYKNFIKTLQENKNLTYRSLLIDDMLDKGDKQSDLKNIMNKRMNNIDSKIEKLMTPNTVYNGNNTEMYQYIKNNQHYN